MDNDQELIQSNPASGSQNQEVNEATPQKFKTDMHDKATEQLFVNRWTFS
ncbi:MAG: hypothetical protein AB2693_13540 [Candidatus Thiodiazotropha sp.]